MILKLLLIVGVVLLVYFLFFKKKPLNYKKKTDTKKSSLQADDMIACAHCGVYAQLDESILSNSKYYCSAECLQKDS